MGDDSRHAPQLELRTCPMCDRTFPVQGRGGYCGPTCRQRAFRLRRRQANQPTLTRLANRLRQAQRLIDQTVYECPGATSASWDTGGDECNLMCRKWASAVSAPARRSSPSPTSSAPIWKEVPCSNPRILGGR